MPSRRRRPPALVRPARTEPAAERRRQGPERSAPRPPSIPRGSRAIAHSPWALPAARGVVALAAIALGVVAFAAHPIGDHFTESDFYDYALGGRGITRGHLDFSRYGVIGPVYELLMSVPALLGLSSFAFARALSVAAATATLGCWLEILRRRLGDVAGLVGVALLAVNPVFFRYGYSATTDMTAIAFQAASLYALLASRSTRAPWIAGGMAGLAVLTRYSSVYLVPGAALVLALSGGSATTRRSAMLRWIAAFAILTVPWTIASVAHGHWPGGALVSNTRFYATPTAKGRNVQDMPVGEAPDRAAGERTETRGLLARVAENVPSHLGQDVRALAGWPVAALWGLGLLVLWGDPRRRAWLPIGAHGVLAFAALTPAFYSDRYSMAVLPFYASLAGVALSSQWLTSWPRRAAWVVPALILAWPLAWSLRESIRLQRFVYEQLPRDVLRVSPLLRRERRTNDGVIARKGAVAFLSGARAVAFPRVQSLRELADHAHLNGARFLYYSWYEALLRSQFAYLLDTTITVPGLARIASVTEPAAALFRIDDGFGRDPAWMADARVLAVHVARGQVRVATDAEAWAAHTILGAHARREGRWDEALEHFLAMTRGRPADGRGWLLVGDAYLELGRGADARRAYENARALAPGSSEPRIGIGWVEYGEGRWVEAAADWRPFIDATDDPRLLAGMVEVFERVGDAPAAAAARGALARRSR
jgi:tetratricopeptide (TPR) repeat protein